MEQIKVSNLTFLYDEDSTFSLEKVSFSVNRGEILLLIGESGCGKTTLLKHFKKAYMPQGKRAADSEIWINGRKIEELNEREQAGIVGFVRQNVDSAQVTDKVWQELAFGLESLGYPQSVMQRKIAEMTAFFGLETIYYEKLSNLSGGQKQLVNLASVMAMEPEVLVLDEPTSQLDPIAATDFFRMIEKINREIGTTIIMTEHRLEEVFSLCDRVLVMERGTITEEGTPRHIAKRLYDRHIPLYKALPVASKLYFELSAMAKKPGNEYEAGKGGLPLTVKEGSIWLERLCKESRVGIDLQDSTESGVSNKKTGKTEKGRCVFCADELWFRYAKEGKDILKACSISLEKGKITAVLGGNGAGKSTLLHVLAGHFPAYHGRIKDTEESIGILPQNPQAMFVKKTVREELDASVLLAYGRTGQERKLENQKIIDFCGLKEVLNQHPFDLSGGQMQKLALAKLLLEDYDILLLDEPGKGMDYAFKEEMGELLRMLANAGKTVLMVSHDVEFCAKYADNCGLFFDGHIVSMEDTRSFFLQNVFYTTSVGRMCREILPRAIVMEDVLRAFGKPEDRRASEKDLYAGRSEKEDGSSFRKNKVIIPEKEPYQTFQKPSTKWISCMIFFLVMPLTIYFGHTVLLQRKYYFISLMVVLEAIASFFLSFEKRKPRLREIMVIAMLSAITVAGRAAFYMIPNVKPMAALTILTGVGLGGEAGFLVGAMSMLISNVFFGQGPWTPWQMFAMGMLGFLTGIIFRQSTPCGKKKKYGICLFGFLSVVLVYGGIMNPASVLMYQENVNVEMIMTAYVMGLPFDVIHGAATFVFLWIGSRPLLEKIERVKKKYGFQNITESGR